MTDEQRTRILLAKENDCDFDGMPVHPHYLHFLECAGFKTISDIEGKTEVEFINMINNSKNRGGAPLSIRSNLGESMAKNLKKYGIIFKKSTGK